MVYCIMRAHLKSPKVAPTFYIKLELSPPEALGPVLDRLLFFAQLRLCRCRRRVIPRFGVKGGVPPDRTAVTAGT